VLYSMAVDPVIRNRGIATYLTRVARYRGRPVKRSVQANEEQPYPFDGVLATGHFS
jgi:hypothetical protein